MKKKILFVIGMFADGGAEKVLINMVNQMDLTKYDITIYCIFDTGRRPQLKEGIRLFFSFKVGKNSNDVIKKKTVKSGILNTLFTFGWKLMPMSLFYRVFVKERYDYEVAYVEGFAHKVVAASTNKESIKYAWVHIDLSVHERAREFYINKKSEIKCYRKFNKILFVSDYAKKVFINKYGKFENCMTQYNLNENEKIVTMGQIKVCDIINKRPLFVTVGRLHDQKGYDRLLKVINRLKAEGYFFQVWIVGDGDRRKEYEKYIVDNSLEEYIQLKGFQDNPYKYISVSDWFIAPSRYEGFSTVVSEAFILEKPVLVTECSGMDELTCDGEYGIIVDNSEEGIYSGIKRILNMNNSEYKYWKVKAKERKSFFEQNKRMAEIQELFT